MKVEKPKSVPLVEYSAHDSAKRAVELRIKRRDGIMVVVTGTVSNWRDF